MRGVMKIVLAGMLTGCAAWETDSPYPAALDSRYSWDESPWREETEFNRDVPFGYAWGFEQAQVRQPLQRDTTWQGWQPPERRDSRVVASPLDVDGSASRRRRAGPTVGGVGGVAAE